MSNPTKIFFIYNPQDGSCLREIENQLAPLVNNHILTYWHQGKLVAGSDWRAVTQSELDNAEIVLPIVSAKFLADAECTNLLKMANDLGKEIVPIIAGSCLWEYDPILKGKTPLPRKDQDTKATPLNKWTPIADGYSAVVEGIMEVVEQYNAPAPTDLTTSRTTNKPNNSPKNTNNMPTSNLVFENGYALLIGVGFYEHCSSLPITISDATVMQQVLTDKNRAAYPSENVSLLIPNGQKADYVTAAKMETALNNFVEKVNKDTNPNKTVIIYYSGHGDVHNKTHYLCPYDYRLWNDEVKNGISAAYFVEAINRINADRILVLLDCCYAGGIKATDSIADKLKEGKGKVIIASSTDKQTSKILGGASYSLFTDLLVQGLAGLCMDKDNNDNMVRVLQLTSYVDTELRKHNMQQNLQINQADGLQSFPICAYDSKYEQKNPIKKWLQSFWGKTAEENGREQQPVNDLPPNPNNNTTNITGNGNIVVIDSNNSTVNIGTNGNANPPKINENNMEELKKQLSELIENNELSKAFGLIKQNKGIFTGYRSLEDEYTLDNPTGSMLKQFKDRLLTFLNSKL